MRSFLFPLSGVILFFTVALQAERIIRNCEPTWQNSKNQGDASSWKFFDSICNQMHTGEHECPAHFTRCCNSTDCPVGVCSCHNNCPHLVCMFTGRCSTLAYPEHGTLERVDSEKSRLRCDRGKKKMILTPLHSGGEFYCDKSSFEWVGTHHRCRGQCGEPNIVSGATIDNREDLLQDSNGGYYGFGGLILHYSCKKGYEQIGSKNYTCNDDNMEAPAWQGNFRCKKKQCKALQEVKTIQNLKYH